MKLYRRVNSMDVQREIEFYELNLNKQLLGLLVPGTAWKCLKMFFFSSKRPLIVAVNKILP